MNERLAPRHNQSGENLHLTELAQENLKRAQAAAEQAEARGEGHKLEDLQHKVETKAVSGKEYTVGEREGAPASHSFGTHKQLKADSYKRSLSHIRSRLSWSDKALSKHVHSKRNEKIDEVVGKTVARPYGLLGGGLAAFIGSAFVLFMANRYGFRYNFSLFLLLFFGGYLVGSLLELVIRLFRRDKHRR